MTFSTVTTVLVGVAVLWAGYRILSGPPPRRRPKASHLGPQHWVQFITDTGELTATWYSTQRDAERVAREYGGRYLGRIDTGLPEWPR